MNLGLRFRAMGHSAHHLVSINMHVFFRSVELSFPPCVCAILMACARSGAQQVQRGPAPTSSGNFRRMCSSSQTWPGPSEMVDVPHSHARLCVCVCVCVFLLCGLWLHWENCKRWLQGRPSIIKFARSAHESAGVTGGLYIPLELQQERGRVSRTGRAGKVFLKSERHNRLKTAQLSSPGKKRPSFPSRTLEPAAVSATSDCQQTCFGLSLHNV